MPFSFDTKISLGNVLTIVTLIGGLLTMLMNNSENVGEVLTAHTTQLAVQDVKILTLEAHYDEIKETLYRLEDKLDNN